MRSSLGAALVAALGLSAATTAAQTLDIGREATDREIAGWDIDARPPGAGLPPGRGTVAAGEKVYNETCVACHGQNGQGPMDRLTGGAGTLDTDKPVKTVGSYWPYATTLFDYIHRAMPFDRPQTLSNDDVYAATAYVLFLNDLIPRDATIDAQSLPQVRMPNRDAFFSPDPRPDVRNTLCMKDCTPLGVGGATQEGAITPSESQ